MSKRQKRLQKLRQNPKNVTFDALQQVLFDYGFYLERTSGSHHVFEVTQAGATYTLSIPVHGTIKPVYVRQALQIIAKLEATAETPEPEVEDEGEDKDGE
jgi:predicted RNA binding protein YcfA (HicA-like mRNA interferase family)